MHIDSTTFQGDLIPSFFFKGGNPSIPAARNPFQKALNPKGFAYNTLNWYKMLRKFIAFLLPSPLR